MKRILEMSKGNFTMKPIQDIVKLRLRGKGSGFKEGPEKKGIHELSHYFLESPDPLHLCVSSYYYDKYITACILVERLLQEVYSDYQTFRAKRGVNEPRLAVKKLENTPAALFASWNGFLSTGQNGPVPTAKYT